MRTYDIHRIAAMIQNTIKKRLLITAAQHGQREAELALYVHQRLGTKQPRTCIINAPHLLSFKTGGTTFEQTVQHTPHNEASGRSCLLSREFPLSLFP